MDKSPWVDWRPFTADRPPQGGGSRQRRPGRSPYLDTCNTKGPQQLQTKGPQLGTIADLAGYHQDNDILYIGDLTDLTQPTKAYKDHISQFTGLKGHDLDEACEADLINYSGVECSETGRAVYYPKYKGGKYSPYQVMKSVSSSARRLAGRLCMLPDLLEDSRESLYIMAQDLTFPQEISQRALTDFDGAVKLADQCAKEYVKQLAKRKRWDRKGYKLMYFYNIHVWHSHREGSQYAVTEPHLHIHLNVINAIFDDEGIFKRFNPFLHRETVKDAWLEAISKKGIEVNEPDFYLHYIPLKHRAKVVHRIKYCSRSVLVDLHGYYKEHDFKPCDQGFNFKLIRYTNQRHNCGALRKLKDYVGELPEGGEDQEDDGLCPVDAHKAVYLGKFSQTDIELKLANEGLMLAYWSQKLRKMVFIGGDIAQRRLSKLG